MPETELDDLFKPTANLSHHPFTLSPGDLAPCEACPASRVFVGPKAPPHPAMWHGIAIHLYIQYAKRNGKHSALGYIRQKFKSKLEICKKIDLDAIPDGEHEQQLFVNLHDHTGGMFAKGQKYPKELGVKSRADLVSFDEDGLSHTIDYKTGDREYPLEGNNQLLTGALAMWLEKPDDRGARASILNIRKTGEVVPHTIVYPVETLESHYTRARRVLLLVNETRAEYHDENERPVFAPGPHCYSCRARSGCPEVK